MVELACETGLVDFRRRVVAVYGGEVLALLGENPVAVEIAVQSEITENVEGVIDVFESPAQLVAPVAPLRKNTLGDLPALAWLSAAAIWRNCSSGWRAWP